MLSTPRVPADCLQTLHAASLRLTPWPLRATAMPNCVICEAPQVVSISRGRLLRYQPPARVNCAFAQRLIRFESIVQEEARAALGSPVRAIVQLGTYNCRRMAAYPELVSEPAFATAIDVTAFLLTNGLRIDVARASSLVRAVPSPPPLSARPLAPPPRPSSVVLSLWWLVVVPRPPPHAEH